RALEPVHVHVMQDVMALAAMHERERRARDPIGDAQLAREALHERGLADTELADEEDEVAATRMRRDDSGRGLRVVDARGAERLHAHVASASLARTKSARICASRSAPPRRAGAGCSVGTSRASPNG